MTSNREIVSKLDRKIFTKLNKGVWNPIYMPLFTNKLCKYTNSNIYNYVYIIYIYTKHIKNNPHIALKNFKSKCI